MTPIEWMITGAAILAAILLIVLICVLVVRRNRKKGVDGKKKVAAILKRFAGIRSFQVLNDLTLKTAKKEVCIDHVLVGFFGILIVNTQNLSADIYGDGRGKNWTHVVTKKDREIKTTISNPLLDNQQAVDAVREILSSHNIYKTSIESYVVFTRRKVNLNLPKDLNVLTLKAFRKLLNRSKYSADGPVDVAQVTAALTGKDSE